MQSDIIYKSNSSSSSNSSISSNNVNTNNNNERNLDSMIVVTNDRTAEFQNLRKKYISRINSDLDNLVLKFKQTNLNVSTLLSNVDIEDKLVKNCCVCGILFGKIFSKKQKCLVCGFFVCSNCNTNPLPINSFDKIKFKNNNGKPIQNVNVCTLCFKTLNTALQRNEHQAMRERGSSSIFVEFYEKMHLNTLDLKRNISTYKQLVNLIFDSGSSNIKRAKELEQSITIEINELKTGIAKLKELKGSTPKQSQVILHVHHAFLTHLNASLPEFKLYATELSSKMKLPPGSSPTSIKSPVNSLKNHETTTTSPTSQSPTNVSPGHDSNSGSYGSGGGRLSTFFSNVFNLGETTPTGHRRSGSSNSNSSKPSYDDLPDRSTILSVVPALCPLAGGCIAIQGENLDKPGIHITIDGFAVKVLQKKNSALLIMSPPRGQESEYDLVIKDGDHILSRQALFYTNSCFQTEKDIDDSNRYALDHYNKSDINNSIGSSGNDFFNSQTQSSYGTSPKSGGIWSSTSSPNFTSQNHNNDEDNQIIAEIVGTLEQDSLLDSSDAIAATGNSFDDLVIQMITPVVTPPTGGRITMHLKYPLLANSVPLVNVGGVPVRIEIGSQRKSIIFNAPPFATQGFRTIDIIYQSKYIEIPNVLFYQPDMQALSNSSSSSFGSSGGMVPPSSSKSLVSPHLSYNTNNNNSFNNNNNSSTSISTIPKSNRVWGKK